MARISGIDLPKEKRVEIGLTYIYGIGRPTATKILAATGVDPDTRVRDLTEQDVAKLRDYIDQHLTVEGDLRREVSLNIKRLVEIGCYRGVCLSEASVPRPTQEHARVRLRPLRIRRSKEGEFFGTAKG